MKNNLMNTLLKHFLKLFFLISLFGQILIAQELKVMSYNIRVGSVNDGENNWEIRKNKVADLMNYYDADFIGMQETQKFQMDFLLEQLPKYNSVGKPRTNGDNGEYSNIFYKINKFELIEQNTFWLSETPDSISKGWDGAYHRNATYALFKLKNSEKFIWVFNTHFDNAGSIARMESARLIIKKIEEISKLRNCDLVFMGDLNSEPDSEPVKYLSQNLVETRSNCLTKPYGNSATWNGFDFQKKSERQIDFIFAGKSNKLLITKFITIDDFYDFKYPSDHFPIMVTFSY